MSECLFPTCSGFAQTNGYCIHHRIYANSAVVKTPKPVNKRGDIQKEIVKQLKEKYPLYLAKKKFKCEVKTPECTKAATCVHHTKGRHRSVVLDEQFWMASCERCNSWVEANHAEAEAMGAKVKQHSK